MTTMRRASSGRISGTPVGTPQPPTPGPAMEERREETETDFDRAFFSATPAAATRWCRCVPAVGMRG